MLKLHEHRLRAWAALPLLCALALILPSCDENGPGGQGLDATGSARAAGPGAPTPANAATPANSSEGDLYTILLVTMNNPATHIQDAQVYQQRLTQGLGWKGVFTLDKAGSSDVCWGKYRTVEDADPNLRIAKNHRTQTGTKPFAQAIVVPLPGADIGPAEWNLRNVHAPYTLLIATFQDDPARNYIGRRKFAVDYCRRLRQGNYDAYFYHFPSMSIVTIGTFGPEAIKGKNEQAQIISPKVLSLQQDFPLLAINGNGENNVAHDASGKIILVPLKTELISVPGDNDHGEKLPGLGHPQQALRPPDSTNAKGSLAPNVRCDVRLVAVGDGAIKAQASQDGSDKELGTLADSLATQLAQFSGARGKSVAILTIRNRSNTDTGRTLCDEVSDKLAGALVRIGQLEVKERIDLRSLLNEKDFQRSQAGSDEELLKNPILRQKLVGVEYVVIGGLTSVPAPTDQRIP